jgi:hypothetical protein
MGVSIGKCLTTFQFIHVYSLFEFCCEYAPIKRNFKNVSCVTSVFFAFTVYFRNDPLREFCHIHLHFTAVGRQLEVYQELLKL